MVLYYGVLHTSEFETTTKNVQSSVTLSRVQLETSHPVERSATEMSPCGEFVLHGFEVVNTATDNDGPQTDNAYCMCVNPLEV